MGTLKATKKFKKGKKGSSNPEIGQTVILERYTAEKAEAQRGTIVGENSNGTFKILIVKEDGTEKIYNIDSSQFIIDTSMTVSNITADNVYDITNLILN